MKRNIKARFTKTYPLITIYKNAKNDTLSILCELDEPTPLECCGIKELNGLRHFNNPANAMLAVCWRLTKTDDFVEDLTRMSSADIDAAHIIFTQAGARIRYGTDLAKFIVENGLGTVVATPNTRNPNSGNPITAFLWTPNKKALCKWWNDQVKALKTLLEKEAEDEDNDEGDEDCGAYDCIPYGY